MLMLFSIKPDISTLTQRYKALISESKGASSALLEKEKTEIIQKVLAELVREAPLPSCHIETEENTDHVKSIFLKYGYYVLLCFGVFEDLANSYFMGSALFLLMIPTIDTAMLFLASIIYASVESILFCLYDSYDLREALGIEEGYSLLSELLKSYQEQVKLATTFNTHLASIPTLGLTDERYKGYLAFLVLLNSDLQKKSKCLQRQRETFFRKAVRIFVLLFGAISSLAGSYFMVTTLMELFCLPLLCTPLGISVICLTMALGLVFHYFMDSTSLTRITNPNYDKFQEIKQEFKVFSDTYVHYDKGLLKLREQYKDNKTPKASSGDSLAHHSLFNSPKVAANAPVLVEENLRIS